MVERRVHGTTSCEVDEDLSLCLDSSLVTGWTDGQVQTDTEVLTTSKLRRCIQEKVSNASKQNYMLAIKTAAKPSTQSALHLPALHSCEPSECFQRSYVELGDRQTV